MKIYFSFSIAGRTGLESPQNIIVRPLENPSLVLAGERKEHENGWKRFDFGEYCKTRQFKHLPSSFDLLLTPKKLTRYVYVSLSSQ